MIQLFKYLNKKQWLLIFASVVLIVGQVFLDLKLPDFMKEITTLLKSGGTTGQILTNGGYMLGCALISALLAVGVGFMSAKIGAGLSFSLRDAVYKKIATFSPTEMRKFKVSSLITRSTNDITQIQQSVAMGLQVIIKAPLTAVWAIVKIVNRSWQLSLVTGIAVAILVFGMTTIIAISIPKFKIVQKQTDELNRVARENLTGVRVIRAFSAEQYMENKFSTVNNNLTRTHLFTGYTMSFMNPLMHTVMNGLSLAIYVVGAFLLDATLGFSARLDMFTDITTFFSLAMQIISSFLMMIMIFMILPRAQVSSKRIKEVLDTVPSISDGKGVSPSEKGTIKFDNVSFMYSDAKEPVLKNISFEAKQGERVAIIGATGSGKSTIIKLLPRLFDVTDGAIYVDGENVKDYKLNDLYDRIGYISQRAVLFSGTVESNVAMGTKANQKASEDKIVEAIEHAQSTTFVQNMNGTYKAKIFQGGTNVSGGQKQRLTIARALARDPEILIFDDSFSALDYQTDKNLRKTLEENFSDTTCIIVAQRIGTIKNCDKILVIENGEIVGIGKHEELLKNCKVYKQIALSQLSKEELDNGTSK